MVEAGVFIHSSPDGYYPGWFVRVLPTFCDQHAMILSERLRHNNGAASRKVPFDSHEREFREVARSLSSQAPFALGSQVSPSEVCRIVRKVGFATMGPLQLLIWVIFCLGSGDRTEADRALKEFDLRYARLGRRMESIEAMLTTLASCEVLAADGALSAYLAGETDKEILTLEREGSRLLASQARGPRPSV